MKTERDAPPRNGREDEGGSLEIDGDRYLLVRAASLGLDAFQLVRGLHPGGPEADAFARDVLFELAHAMAKSDARAFYTRAGIEDAARRFDAAPGQLLRAGWGRVAIFPESRLRADEEFCLLFELVSSFEGDAWIRAGNASTAPVCTMSAGYVAGWYEQSAGVALAASELSCRACGDASCRFVVAPPPALEQHHLERAPRARLPLPDFFSRKRSEDEIRRVRAELELRVEELAAANERLRREMREREEMDRRLRQTHKLEAVGRLAGGIAHDFNNLLNVVIGRSERLRCALREDDPAAVQLAEITAAGERAAALTRQLLSFSTTRALHREAVDLNALVSEMASMLLPLIGEDVTLAMALDEEAGCVFADRSQLEQALINLAVNARDAMPEGGTLSISTERRAVRAHPELALAAGEYIVLSVRDTGRGMTADTLGHLFEPFFTTKESGGGTGLGLSTVYAIVRQAGGAIEVDSALGEGARFELFFPRLPPPSAPGPAAPAPVAARGGKVRVLLVEDQPALRHAIADVLSDQGYVVLDAIDPERALDLAASSREPIDVLLTDVIMPGMSGRELAALVTKQHPDVRVLLMSGHSADAELRAMVQAGRAQFLAKPFTPAQLSAKLRGLLGLEDAAGG